MQLFFRKNQKLILLFLTIPPFFGIFLGYILPFIVGPAFILSYIGYYLFGFIMLLYSISIPWIIVMLFYYLHRILRDPQFDEKDRVQWMIFLAIGHIFAMYAYWYLHINQSPKTQTNSSPSTH